MKSLATFEEFLKLGIITERSPDIPRATFLIKESKYYGKVLDKEYAKQTVSFLTKVYPSLIKQTNI